MSRSKLYLFFIVLLFFIVSSFGCGVKKNNNQLNLFFQNIFVGSVAGVLEIAFVGQFLFSIKNRLQQIEKKNDLSYLKKMAYILKNLKQQPLLHYYRGIGINAVCMVPTTAAQISCDALLKEMISRNDLLSSLVRNGAAGVLATLIANPTELIIVNQQKRQISTRKTISHLYSKYGATIFFRGFVPKASRDGIFCAAFLTAYPKVKDYLEQETGNAALATLLTITSIGTVTAAMSHPFDTVSIRMQADCSQVMMKGFLSAIKTIYKESGYKDLFTGFAPRTMRIAVAIPLIATSKEWLNKKI